MPRPSIACQALADYRYRQAHTTQTDGCDNNSTGGPFDRVSKLRGVFEGEFLALDIVPESWCRQRCCFARSVGTLGILVQLEKLVGPIGLCLCGPLPPFALG